MDLDDTLAGWTARITSDPALSLDRRQMLPAAASWVLAGASRADAQEADALLPATPAQVMRKTLETSRHRTSYLQSGPAKAPTIIFLHGWPDLGLTWRNQLDYFGAIGWRCIAPDMRGYGGSSVPTQVSAYAVREAVADMLELHDSLNSGPVVWVGHSLGCAVVWALAAHHPERCRAIVNMTVPYLARGNALANLKPLIDRKIYPVDQYPVGQWDYMLYYVEQFSKAVHDVESDLPRTVDSFYQPGSASAVGRPSPLARIRDQGGWFPKGMTTPQVTPLLSADERGAWINAFAQTGFAGPCSWYLNDADNAAFAAQAPTFGRLALPVLFLHATWDTVCDTAFGRLADPMRQDCSDLTELRIASGHLVMRERPDETNRVMQAWLGSRRLDVHG